MTAWRRRALALARYVARELAPPTPRPPAPTVPTGLQRRLEAAERDAEADRRRAVARDEHEARQAEQLAAIAAQMTTNEHEFERQRQREAALAVALEVAAHAALSEAERQAWIEGCS